MCWNADYALWLTPTDREMFGTLTINLFLLVIATGIVLITTSHRRRTAPRSKDSEIPTRRNRREAPETQSYRPERALDLFIGIGGAVVILVVLFLLRRFLPLTGITIAMRPRSLGWIAAVVILEECMKLTLVGSLRSQIGGPRRGVLKAALRGWGFAAAEHLLYLFLLPSRFVVRLLLAGTLHTATAVWYAWPQQPQRSHASVSLARISIAIAGHIAFNVTVTSLDTILTLW